MIIDCMNIYHVPIFIMVMLYFTEPAVAFVDKFREAVLLYVLVAQDVFCRFGGKINGCYYSFDGVAAIRAFIERVVGYRLFYFEAFLAKAAGFFLVDSFINVIRHFYFSPCK